MLDKKTIDDLRKDRRYRHRYNGKQDDIINHWVKIGLLADLPLTVGKQKTRRKK